MVTRYDIPMLSKLVNAIRRHVTVTTKSAHVNGHWKAYDNILS